MSVKIRLNRMGRRKRPFFRIVAVDSRKKRDGAYLEKLGHYDPLSNPPEVKLDEERALHWLNEGAIPSDTVRSLLSERGIMMKYDLAKKGASPDKIEDEVKKLELIRRTQAEEAAKKKEAEASQKKTEEAKAAKTEPAPAEEPAPEAAPPAETEAKEEPETSPGEPVPESDSESEEKTDEEKPVEGS